MHNLIPDNPIIGKSEISTIHIRYDSFPYLFSIKNENGIYFMVVLDDQLPDSYRWMVVRIVTDEWDGTDAALFNMYRNPADGKIHFITVYDSGMVISMSLPEQYVEDADLPCSH